MAAAIVLVGGTGFIGRRLAARLAARGAAVRLVARGVRDVPAGPYELLRGSIEDAALVARAVDGAAAVVNLVGTTAARRAATFYALHRDAPERLAQAARAAGVARFVQVSAMGVAPGAPSLADRSKAAGERAVRAAFADATIVRPALVYGPEDHFFARFAPLVRRAPAIPLVGGGRTRFQPMHVDDVAEAMARALESSAAAGRIYEFGADEVLTLRELFERLGAALGRRPRLVPVPFALAAAAAALTQWLPGAPLTVDQVRLLETDKVVGAPERAPAALGVTPRPLAPFLAALARG